MRIDNRSEYPIYLNPDPTEIAVLADRWDTIRIIVASDDSYIAMASGYGNTHQTVISAVRNHLHLRRTHSCDDYILFRQNGVAFLNLESVTGEQYTRSEKWGQFLSTEHVAVLRDLVRESGLSL